MMNFLTINNGHSGKWHVMMVALAAFIYVSPCATVKAEPCIRNSFLLSSWQVPFELSNSFTESVKPRSKIIVNVFRPISGNRINLSQFSVESVDEFFGGIIEYISSSYFRFVGDSDKNQTQRATNTQQGDVNSGKSESKHLHIFLFFLPIYLVAIFFDVDDENYNHRNSN